MIAVMSTYSPFSPVSSANFVLRKVHALQGMDVLMTGSNLPMLIVGIEPTSGEKGEYVIKFKAGARMTDPSAALREVCGAYMAREIGLLAAEPTIIEVGQPFIDSLIGHDLWQIASNSLGSNFATVYISKAQSLKSTETLTEGQIREGKKIFAFDAMILNFDRSNGKPNMLTDGNNIFLFDHEIAFAFSMALPWDQNPTPWILSDNDKQKLRQHYFWPHLVGKNVSFSELEQDFAALNEEFWRNLRLRIPPEWQTDQLDRIQPYISEIVNHRTEFLEDLRLLLC